ncbi:MAG TPA: hypothetical protein VN736_06000 [Candidatus Limnocylindrales bacterium]|nr:hypothetical protein [Candidatus Limnocylindrales bacterium]
MQKAELKKLHVRSPAERDGFARALRLNCEALGFAAEGRTLEAHVQFMFVEAVLMAMRDGRYESEFRRVVEGLTGEPA